MIDRKPESMTEESIKTLSLQELASELLEIKTAIEETQKSIKRYQSEISSCTSSDIFFRGSNFASESKLSEAQDKTEKLLTCLKGVKAEITLRLNLLDPKTDKGMEQILNLNRSHHSSKALELNPSLFEAFGKSNTFIVTQESLQYIPKLALFAPQTSFPISEIEFTDSTQISLHKYINEADIKALMRHCTTFSFANFHPDNDCMAFLEKSKKELGERYNIRKIHVENMTLDDATLFQSMSGPKTKEISTASVTSSNSVKTYLAESIKNRTNIIIEINPPIYITDIYNQVFRTVYKIKNRTVEKYADIETARKNIKELKAILPTLVTSEDESALNIKNTYIYDENITCKLKQIATTILQIKNKTVEKYADIETARKNIKELKAILPTLVSSEDESALDIKNTYIYDENITSKLKQISITLFELKNNKLQNYKDIETARNNVKTLKSVQAKLVTQEDESLINDANTFILDNAIANLFVPALMNINDKSERTALAIKSAKSHDAILDFDFNGLEINDEFIKFLNFKRIILKFKSTIAAPNPNLYLLKNKLDEAEIICIDDECKSILTECKQQLFNEFCIYDFPTAIHLGQKYGLDLSDAYQLYANKLSLEIKSNAAFSFKALLNAEDILKQTKDDPTHETTTLICYNYILFNAEKAQSKKEILFIYGLLKQLPLRDEFKHKVNDRLVELTKKRITILQNDHPQISTLPILIKNTNAAIDLDAIQTALKDYVNQFSKFNKFFMKKLIEEISRLNTEISALAVIIANNKTFAATATASAPGLNDGDAIAAASAPPLNEKEDEDDLPEIGAEDAAIHEEFSKPIPGLLANLSLLTRKIDLNSMSDDEINELFPKVPKQEGLRGTAARVSLKS